MPTRALGHEMRAEEDGFGWHLNNGLGRGSCVALAKRERGKVDDDFVLHDAVIANTFRLVSR